MDLKNKRVLVVGLARTGVATALFCAARGARVTATESRTEAQIGDVFAQLRAAGVTLELGPSRGDHIPPTRSSVRMCGNRAAISLGPSSSQVAVAEVVVEPDTRLEFA